MSDHINIMHPEGRLRLQQERVEIQQLKARITVLETSNEAMASDLAAIFTRIARGDQVELHYPDGSVVPITRARRRNGGEEPEG